MIDAMECQPETARKVVKDLKGINRSARNSPVRRMSVMPARVWKSISGLKKLYNSGF